MLETIPWIAAGLGWTTAGVMSYMAYRRRSPQSQKKTKKRPVPLTEAIFEDPNSMALIKDDYLPQRTMMVSRDVYESLKKATKQGKQQGKETGR